MIKSTLLETLRTFTKSELSSFEDFIRSPYFNKQENVVKLFEEIKKYAPAFNDSGLEKEIVWSRMFGDAKYNYGIMKNLIHDLGKLTVNFLKTDAGNSGYGINNLLEQYMKRGLSNQLKRKIREVKEDLKKQKPGGENYFLSYKIEKVEIDEIVQRSDMKEIFEHDLDKINESLTLYYFITFFNSNYTKLFVSNVYNKKADTSFIEKILLLYDQGSYKNYYADTYSRVLKIALYPSDENNYSELKKIFFENFDNYTRADQFDILSVLQSFCKTNSFILNINYHKEAQLYRKVMDDNNLFFPDDENYINISVFLNTVVSASSAGEFDWCIKFIDKYQNFLEPAIKDECTNLALTCAYFKNKDYETSLSYLSKCENPSPTQKINLKTYQICNYYELRYYDQLNDLINAMRKFLKNDKIYSEGHKTSFKNFMNSVSRLSDYRYNLDVKKADDSKLNELKLFVQYNNMLGKKWLLEKIQELE